MENQQNNSESNILQGGAYIRKATRGFGQIGKFWKHYDDLADRTDKEMSKKLNGNLDVLLIFAGLFSAVNTTFISLTMPNLSPDPSAETNALLRLIASRDSINGTIPQTNISADFSPQPAAIAANCLLYVSLCCSLLAAVGAMLGKEWLQSLDRTGQRGSLEEQGRIRQQKFSGVQQWHLEGTIVFLPNLLLLSVMFFFAGLSLFLIPINNVVAGTVIAFFALGATLAGATIVVGAISSSCPYQSAPSRALRGTLRDHTTVHTEQQRKALED
ncbi:hypothetical protein FRC04_003055 [Tulasnella sp. 424]|nr:hypothetical protein FRC04_003055 [Tulasnella sp. 424]